MQTAVPLLVERGDELAQLDRAAEHVADRHGAFVVVTAPAGLGKSTILDATAQKLRDRGVRLLRARASDQERNFSYGIVRSLFGRAVQDAHEEGLFTGGAAGAQAVFGLTDADPTSGHVVYGLYWMVANLCRSGPLALIIDDAHEADDESLAFLAYLARRLDDLPVLLLVATRPAEQAGLREPLDEWRSRSDVIVLQPLSLAGVASVVEASFDERPDPEFTAACQQSTAGNPFYLRELLRDVIDRGARPTAATARDIGKLAPRTIVRSVLLGLARLPSGAVELAQACAVLGDNVPVRRACALAGLEPDSAARAADALVAAQVLAGGPNLSFAHPLLRTAVLADIGDQRRARWHAQAAALLRSENADPQEVGAHLLESTPAGDPQVVDLLLSAAHAAAETGSPAGAAVYLSRALDEPPPEHVRGDLLFELAQAEIARLDVAAFAHLTESLALAGDAETRARRALVLAEVYRKVGLSEDAVDTLDLPSDGLTAETAASVAMERHWIARQYLATIDRARPDTADLLPAHALPDGAVRRSAAAYLGVETAIASGVAAALPFLDQAVGPPGLLGQVLPDAPAVSATLLGFVMTEQHESFDRLVNDVLQAASRQGNLVASMVVAICRGMLLVQQGHLTDAVAECTAGLEVAAELGWPQGPGELHARYTQALVALGDFEGANHVVATAPFPLDAPTDYPTLLILAARGHVRLATGRPAEALADFMSCGDHMKRLRADTPTMLDWRGPAALASLASGDDALARTLARETVERADTLAGPAMRASAYRVLGVVTGGREGVIALEHALELADATPSPLVQAQVLTDLGSLLRRTRKPADARPYLARAVDLAHRCQAAPLEARARDELRVAGGRPRRTSVTGPESLTSAEERVVRLAADGLTNTEIAQQLFVTRKTVEKQLSGAYAKLGITSRRELSATTPPRTPAVRKTGHQDIATHHPRMD